MEKSLIEFVNTLDLSLKKLQKEVGESSGISKLTIHQFQYIDAIHELGGPTITEIAEKLNITKASVTTGIKKLIQMGYVNKTQSTEDQRVFHVNLSKAGEKLIKAKYQALKEYGEFIGAALSKEEAGRFEETLTKIVKLFKKD
jgi:DNA-binding MarR family transcriptional regulator